MEAINKVPVSLYKTLSDKLVSIILDSDEKDAVSTEMTKKIIYLWRQDQLASPTGIETLIRAAATVDSFAVTKVMDDLGLKELTVAVKNL
ncbi:MAG TPA: hypothetical protein VMW22_00095 [Candidatus Desulfaltia sp.]|nr:hypothetical protein [Candidatus Desulfaltia sp.]